ncbi:Tn3 family transposase [Paraburkholderia susongensis]|uniref:Tn3 transposase DDE domain-containing protein n=1 Tax=Paraburkholderia susongensis TaxID=1515439 RepID=A0A1X7M6I7_9BURK|nr:Tn3 transposase DDE domain-containing protein [Paraburkholderia susongensis]
MQGQVQLRNTVYLERVIPAMHEQGGTSDETLLKHVSPMHWNHIILTDDYD